MRIRLTLQPTNDYTTIPINYQYPLSAVIYNILSTASPEFAYFLHEQGYISPTGKPLKLFCFSNLQGTIRDRKQSDLLRSHITHPLTLFISSPMLQDFVQNFIIGMFQQQTITIRGRGVTGQFTVTQVETEPMPEFTSPAKFTCLSPIVLSRKHEHRGKDTVHYLRPDDPQLSDAMQHNLRQKYETVHKQSATNLYLTCTLDDDYIQRRAKAGKRVTKMIHIKQDHESEHTKIIAFEVPFTLTGSRELIDIAWECGIGEKNSLGFGMVG